MVEVHQIPFYLCLWGIPATVSVEGQGGVFLYDRLCACADCTDYIMGSFLNVGEIQIPVFFTITREEPLPRGTNVNVIALYPLLFLSFCK